jgi:hypothetical protein
MAKENEPIKPLLSCPTCGQEMRILGIEPAGPKRDIYTFECESCDTLEVRGVRVL